MSGSITKYPVSFPATLQEFQREFPDDAACARFLERLRWPDGFVCSKCGEAGEPYRFPKRRTVVLRCRACQANTSLTSGTVMQQSHMPLSVWFWGAYLLSSQRYAISTTQFQQQLDLHYKTAYQVLRKLRAGMLQQDAELIGAKFPVEVDATLVGGYTEREGRAVYHKALLVAGAVEVRSMAPADNGNQHKKVDFQGKLHLRIIQNRGARALTDFVQESVAAGAVVRTDGWHGFDGLAKLGYAHEPLEPDCDDQKAKAHLSMIHHVFSNLNAWLCKTHNESGQNNLQTRLNAFVAKFNLAYCPPKDEMLRGAAQWLLLS